jgi:hypothetical protein
MKRFVLGLAALLALPALAVSAEGPKLVVEDADFHFGQVYQGSKVEHTFRFRNAGGAPLVIDNVRSSCGCTAALVSATVIPPGGAGEVRATFDSGRFRGPVEKTIYLHVNDPQQPVARMHVRGTVTPEIRIEPEQVDFGTLAPGVAREARITLSNQGDREVAFPAVTATAAELQAELTASALAPGKSAQLVIRAAPKAGKPRLSGYVLIRTNSPRSPELRIPVYGSIAETVSPR